MRHVPLLKRLEHHGPGPAWTLLWIKQSAAHSLQELAMMLGVDTTLPVELDAYRALVRHALNHTKTTAVTEAIYALNVLLEQLARNERHSELREFRGYLERLRSVT